MAVTEFNMATDVRADRKLFVAFVDVGTTSTPDWEVLGRGVESAAYEFNHDVENTTDILGISETTVKDAKPQMDMDPNSLRGGQKLAPKLLDIERRNAKSELSNFSILVAHLYQGSESTGFTAELHKNCTIVPQSEGGDAYVDLPISVYLSNDKTLGTVKITGGKPTFTPST